MTAKTMPTYAPAVKPAPPFLLVPFLMSPQTSSDISSARVSIDLSITPPAARLNSLPTTLATTSPI